MKTDVAIIGGGPAGAATALMLRKQFPRLQVAIIERGCYDRVRIGESLQPVARPLLQQLAVWDAFLAENHLPAYGSRAAWGTATPHDNEYLFQTHGNGWHLDRCRFDAFLARCAEEAGVVLLCETRLTSRVSGSPGAWRLSLDGAHGPITMDANFVVDASGRGATFARGRGARKAVHDRLIGTWHYFEQSSCDSYTLVEAVADGWWYSAKLPDGRLVVSLMSDQGKRNWMEALAQTQLTAARIGKAQRVGQQGVTPAYSQCLQEVAGPGWMAVGDAAATLDPLSSQGIFKALRSGIFAAYSLGDHLVGKAGGLKRFQQYVHQEYRAYLNTRTQYYRRERRWADQPFWRNRHRTLTFAADSRVTEQQSV